MKPPPYATVPTGELELNIEGVYDSRHRWRDGKKQRLEERLNAVIEGLISAALLEKQREAERERERQRREEAERRRKERQKRRLEEEARIERFNMLVAYWRKTQERRAFLEQLRQAVGAVEVESPLGQWLAWAEAYVEGSDPLDRFQTRKQTVKLYFSGYSYQIRQIKERGFEDPEPSNYQRDKFIPGIAVRDRRPGVDSLEEIMEFELTEDLILPYEVTEPGAVT